MIAGQARKYKGWLSLVDKGGVRFFTSRAVTLVVPPRATAVPSPAADAAPSQRDRHIQLIRDRGRLGWQRAVGYGRRALGEAAVSRYKALIGPGLRARSLPAQKTEAQVGCPVLNRMTRLGVPVSRRIS